MAQQAHQNGSSSLNANKWRKAVDCLDSQWLVSLGLRRVACASGRVATRSAGNAERAAGLLREALPVGNTGITSLLELASV